MPNRTRLFRGWPGKPSSCRGSSSYVDFAHNLDRGGMRRTWLRGLRERAQAIPASRRRHNLSMLMRQLIRRRRIARPAGRCGRNWRLFVLVTPVWITVLVVQRPHPSSRRSPARRWPSSRDMLRASGVKPGQCALFQRAVRAVTDLTTWQVHQAASSDQRVRAAATFYATQ